jgi:hypothetical protein
LLNKSNFAELKDQITYLPDNADRSGQSKSSKSPTGPPTIKPSSTVAPSLSGWMMKPFRPGMSRQRLHQREDLSAILISPSPPFWSLNAFRLTLRAAQGFIDSIFTLMNVPLRCPDYTCVASAQSRLMSVSKRSPEVKSRIW